MERPARFEHQRYLGDKRSQVVYDLDHWDDPAVIEELMAAETFLCFGPDELSEAHNRGYRLARPGRRSRRRSPRDETVTGDGEQQLHLRDADPRLPPRLSRRAPDHRRCPR